MPKKEIAIVPDRKDAFTRVLRFLTQADVTLTAVEETIMDRWIFCDALLRAGTKTQDEIIADIVERWSVSRFTAMNDINQTQRLFERARKASKKYLGHIHLERIQQDLMRYRAEIFCIYEDPKTGKKEQRVPDDKEMNALAKMADAYTKALAALPDDEVADKMPPPVFNFNMAPGQAMQDLPSPEEAMALADKYIDMVENGDGVFEIAKDE